MSLRTTFFIGILAFACASPRPAPPAPVAAEGPTDAGVPPDAWRKERPKPGSPPPFELPHFQQAQLKNGLTVLVAERRDLPLVSVVMAFAAGSSTEPAKQAGLADLTYRLMLEGAGKRNALQLAEAFADLGVTPSAMVQPDGALIGTQVAARNLPAALGLLSDIVRRPQLTADGFQRRREERLADLLARNVEPRVAAARAFLGAVFGPAHSYGHATSGTQKTLKALKPTDARAFYQRWVGPRTSALILTGDVSLPEATQWAEKHFGDWKGTAKRPTRPVPPPDLDRRSVQWVSRPGLEQTVVLLGRRAVAAGDPDEATLELVMAGLGGNFGSRLNLKLREEKGYSYGTSAVLDARRGMGAWLVSAAVEAKSTGAALKLLAAELEGLHSHPFSSTELESARGTLVRALPASFETTEATALALAGLFFQEQPLDEYHREVAAMEAATPETLAKAVESHLLLSKVQIVLVGDPEILAAQVPETGLGPLEKVNDIP